MRQNVLPELYGGRRVEATRVLVVSGSNKMMARECFSPLFSVTQNPVTCRWTMMASRRLISSALRRTSFRNTPSPLYCLTVPSVSRQENEQRYQCHFGLPLSHVRNFSAVETEKKSLRDRAEAGARKGAKAARKGATSAKEMIQQYGPVFIGTYISVYFITLGALFTGVDSGLIDPVKIMSWIGGHAGEDSKSAVTLVVEYMEKYEWTKPYAETVAKNPHFASLGVAWVAVKFTEPIRLAVTVGIVPKLARHFGFVNVKEEGATDEGTTEDATTIDGEATDPVKTRVSKETKESESETTERKSSPQ